MNLPKNIGFVTLLLASVAGFCDTTTFLAADKIFSAHVTGNFIVFAYQVVKGSEPGAWVKLLTLPVFILAVITGGWMARRWASQHLLLLTEGLLLLAGGIIAWIVQIQGVIDNALCMYGIVMLIVFAMGLQNAFGRLFGKETHGPTTMMTGNVTQASLDLGLLIKTKFTDTAARGSLSRQLITIGGFLIGCLTGAVASKYIGLSAVCIPGLILTVYYSKTIQQ